MAVSPVSGTETVLGETVSNLQADIAVANGGIQGLSKYVDGFTQFSGDPDLQHGNYLVLHATAAEGSVLKYQSVYKDGTLGNLVTLDSDGILVVRLTENTDKMKFIATKNGMDNVLYYSLDGLTLEDPEAFSITLAAGGNCTKTGDYQVYEGETATITLHPDTGYELPSTINVSGAAYTYDSTTGEVELDAPVANITVTCVCTAIEYAITTSVTNGTASGDSVITYGGTATVTIAKGDGYKLPASITVNGDSGTSGSGSGVTWSYNATSGVVSLENPTAAVSIVAVCEAALVFSALEVGDSISGGQSIYVKKVQNIDNILQALVMSGATTLATCGSLYPTISIIEFGGSYYLRYVYGGSTQNITIYNSNTKVWSASIEEDGKLALPGSVTGTITALAGNGWNGVVIGKMAAPQA